MVNRIRWSAQWVRSGALIVGFSFQCRPNMTSWAIAIGGTSISTLSTSQLPSEIQVLFDTDCVVRIPAGATAATPVNLTHYSLLVDLEQLTFNLTITVGLINGTEKDEIAILVHHSQEDGTFDYMSASRSKSF